MSDVLRCENSPWCRKLPRRSSAEAAPHSGDSIMLSWALTFLVIAIIAAVLGFVSLAGTAAWAAKICFVVFLVLFVVSALTGRRTPSV